jgi:predicted permease
MILFAKLGSWWNALIHRTRVDNDVESELQFHIDAHTQQLIDSGIPPREAERRSRAEFGRADLQKEKYRSAIGLRPFEEIGGDLRYGLRSLYRKPGFALVAILSLALGIGSTTAIFSLIYATLLHPFLYVDADRIVNTLLIDEAHSGVPLPFAIEPSQFEALKKARSVESALGFFLDGLTETGNDLPEDVQAAYVTANVSSFLGVSPKIGRDIQPFDAPDGRQSSNVVVLAFKFWQQRYDGDPKIIGKLLQLNHENYTIIGVMPRRFTFTEAVSNADVYIPWSSSRPPMLIPWIKVKPGIGLSAANAELQSFLDQFKRETPDLFPPESKVRIQPIIEPYVRRDGSTLLLLFASVVLLLLIGCANCSILLLARGEARKHEFAIRSAIGGSRFRIVRQLFIESLAMSCGGATIGVALSFWLARLPLQLMPQAFPQESAITINLPVLFFSIGLVLFTSLVFGLYPALRLSRPNHSQVIQSTSRTIGTNTNRYTLNVLIGIQITLTFLLLGAAGTSIAGFLKITSTQLGYDPHNVLIVGLPLKREINPNRAARAAYINQIRDRAAGLPGVISVAVSMRDIPPAPPLGPIGLQAPFEIWGSRSQQGQLAAISLVSPEYFSTLKIALLKGRLWDQSENQRGDFVTVVNQTLAQRYWPNGDAIGHQIRVDALTDERAPLAAASPQSRQQREIIGVVADSRNDGLDRPTAPAIYVPYTTFMEDYTQLIIRTTGQPLTSLKAIRTAFHVVNSEQRVIVVVDDLEESLQHQPVWALHRVFSVLFSFFAVLALALSLVGLASTLSFAIAQRTSELGIRMALGAQRSHIVWIVLRTTLTAVGGGIIVGLILNFFLERVLRHWMPDSVDGPWMLASVTLLFLICATITCLLPARRAANLDPRQTLRYE